MYTFYVCLKTSGIICCKLTFSALFISNLVMNSCYVSSKSLFICSFIITLITLEIIYLQVYTFYMNLQLTCIICCVTTFSAFLITNLIMNLMNSFYVSSKSLFICSLIVQRLLVSSGRSNFLMQDATRPSYSKTALQRN